METIDLSRYDSTEGVPTLDRQLELIKQNDIDITSISHKVNFNNEFYTFDYNILYEYKNYLSQFIVKTECPETLYYHPEIVSKILYGTIDLWYLVMMFNPIPSVAEFNQPVIYVFDPIKIKHVNNILNKHKKDLKYNNADPEFVERHTLTKVRIKDTRLI